MASPGTMTRYDLVGVKEEISDIISNISPTKTPFQSMIGSESIDNTLAQWQEDSLLAVGTSAMVEGANAAAASWQATVMRSNNTQIMTSTASASGTADRVKKYGRAKELSYQLGLRSAELKRNMENALVGTGQTAVAGSSTTARVFAGYQAQILSGTTITNSSTVLTEANVVALEQTLYTNGADPSVLMIKPADSLKVSAFKTTGRTQFVQNADTSVVNNVKVYESPFGSVKIVMNRFQRATDALMFDPANWKKLVLRNWFRETLAKTGDSTQVMIVGEFSLKHKNYASSGLITGLS